MGITAGFIALLLHFADDEEHAKRAWEKVLTWEPADGWAAVNQAKKALELTKSR